MHGRDARDAACVVLCCCVSQGKEERLDGERAEGFRLWVGPYVPTQTPQSPTSFTITDRRLPPSSRALTLLDLSGPAPFRHHHGLPHLKHEGAGLLAGLAASRLLVLGGGGGLLATSVCM